MCMNDVNKMRGSLSFPATLDKKLGCSSTVAILDKDTIDPAS